MARPHFVSIAVSIAVSAAVLLLSSGVVLAGSKNSSSRVDIVNNSNWAIHELYLSSSADTHWGPDQLKEQTIESGESFQLNRIPCDTYDVRLVDEDQDECVVNEVSLCAGQGTWEITDDYLLACQAETE